MKMDLPCRVSCGRENRENRELAGIMNDPGKIWKLPDFSQKEGKPGKFHSIILLFLKKKIVKSILAFFLGKTKTLLFLYTGI